MVTFNLERFKNVLQRFANHLREFGEVKAAEAVESVIKTLPLYISK